MSTRSALIFPNTDGTFTTVYCHYDGQPEFMMPAMRAHDPEDIRSAVEIRQITPTEIESYPRPLRYNPTPTAVFPEWACHAYLLTSDGWSHCANQTDLDQLVHSAPA